MSWLIQNLLKGECDYVIGSSRNTNKEESILSVTCRGVTHQERTRNRSRKIRTTLEGNNNGKYTLKTKKLSDEVYPQDFCQIIYQKRADPIPQQFFKWNLFYILKTNGCIKIQWLHYKLSTPVETIAFPSEVNNDNGSELLYFICETFLCAASHCRVNG